ncbi:MAG: hypothetical protein KJ043_16560 [Anaerolineae bacterium]|nr:hypothetical protein [Anaerolineae bacterium]
MFTIQVRSRIIGGDAPLPNVALDLLTETLTIRDLITHTVEEQIRDLRIQRQMDFDNIQHILNRQYLTDAEIQAQAKTGAIKMPELPNDSPIFIIQETEKALTAFEKGVYVIIIDGEQAQSLNDTVTLKPTSKVTFLRLTPLKGG